MRPTIGVVSMWFDEEKLADWFMDHYRFADLVHVVIDADTRDRSREIVQLFPNGKISEFRFPNGMDDTIKAERLSTVARAMDTDWVIVVDADEFVFTATGLTPHETLERESWPIVPVQLWNVYRNKANPDLDPHRPALSQRLHGDPDMVSDNKFLYRKPIVVNNRKLDYRFRPGNHQIIVEPFGEIRCYAGPHLLVSENAWAGAHWSMADVDIAIDRRIRGRRDRMSQHNIQEQLTLHNHRITEAEIREECRAHLHDPQVLFLR